MNLQYDLGDEKNVPEILARVFNQDFKLTSMGPERWPSHEYQQQVYDFALADLARRLNRIAHLKKEERESKDNVARAQSLRAGCVLIHNEKIRLNMAKYKKKERHD